MTEIETPEITLESIAEVEDISTLTEDQTTFLRDNADTLSDEQKETYKDVLKTEEDDKELNPDDVEIETRGKSKVIPKKDGEDEDEDADLEEDDKKVISRIVEKKLREAGVGDTQNQIEVDAFIRSKPEFGKYRSVALKYLNHDAYRNIPIHNIMAIVSAKDMQSLGAQKERDAARKAKDTQNKGTPNRVTANKTFDWGNASKEDFEAKKAEVLGRQGN